MTAQRRQQPVALSKRARSIEMSPTVAVSQLAAELKAKGERILNLSVGEPDQPTPVHIRRAAAAALESGMTRYTSSAGLPELRAAVAKRYAKDFDVSFSPQQVVATIGGKHALYAICQVLLNPGDEVIIPTPHWPTFTEAVRLAGGRPVMLPTKSEDGFRVTARMVSRKLTKRTKAVLLCTPSNPTGAVIHPDDLLAIGSLARRKGLSLLYDDTYAQLVYAKHRGRSCGLRELHQRVGDQLVVLGTASKSYCMTGWRIGWIIGSKAVAGACAKINSHSTQCPTAFAQAGAIEALTASQRVVRDMAKEYRARRNLIHKRITSIPGVSCLRPEGAFYLFPRVDSYLSATMPTTLAMAQRLLQEEGVAVVPGEGFGTPGFVRISFASSREVLSEAAERLEAFFGRA